MIVLRPSEIYISTANVDMRKSIDGLASVVQQKFRLDTVSDAMFVFHNRHCDKIKILYWDKDGFCLLYKRMERGKFRFPQQLKGDTYRVSEDELYWLLHGLHIEEIKHYESLKPSFERSVISQTPTGKMTEIVYNISMPNAP